MIVFQNISIEDTFLKRDGTPNALESGGRERNATNFIKEPKPTFNGNIEQLAEHERIKNTM